MTEFMAQWFIIASLTLLCAASPGPDFVIVVRNAVLQSRKAGLFTALGITLGVCVHMTYCIAGIAALIAGSVRLFSIIKWAGAAYLVYIGFKALRSKGYGNDGGGGDVKTGSAETPMAALRSGFLTNLLNPKATMFFFALFTQVIDPHTPLNVQIFYSASVVMVNLFWWGFVALVLTDKRIKTVFLRFSKWIDRLTGGLLIALGVRLALTRS